MKRVAVIGGGLTGCLAALECADRGHQVTLFERESDLLSRASTANEGKIHLGYCYAADSEFRTAERLIEDALLFRPILERWLTHAQFETCITEPFYYAIPADSALPADTIAAHFARVDAQVRERGSRLGLTYLGRSEAWDVRPLPQEDDDPTRYFYTQERGVWPPGIAEGIDRCVRHHPRVELRFGCRVHRLDDSSSRWRIHLRAPEDVLEGPFDLVVNAAWAERRAIDRRSGFPATGRWYTRYKFGVLVQAATSLLPGGLPRNTTATSGPFGDCIHYRADDSLYCSWYPVGMIHSTMDDELSDRPVLPDKPEALMRRTFEGCAGFAPALASLVGLPAPLPARIIGDYIIAKGWSDIVDLRSELHKRSDHGVQQLGPGYVSIETGKYTSAPRCAMESVVIGLGA